MDDDQFNINIRKYLKKVGITSQREIENAVRSALDTKAMSGDETLDVKVRLSIGALNLSVDIDGEIEGVFIGVANQLWYSRKKQAADLFFYVTDKGKGWGSSLLRRYIQWARFNKGVAEITLGVMSGIGDMERTKKLYEKLGAVKVGDSYVLPKEK